MFNNNHSLQQVVNTGLNATVETAAKLPDWLFEPPVERLLHRGIRHPEGADFLVKALREIRRIWPNLAPNVRQRFVENIFGHTMLFHTETHKKAKARYGTWPSVMVISPTMRCNLKCEGCYSANYSRKDLIDTATFHRIVGEARDLGIHFVVVSGGEPFIRKDFLDVAAAYPEVLFMTYTNGTFISDDNLAPKLAELGNIMPCISVEGFDEETDKRRGKGTFRKIIDAMGQLRNEGVLFGFSATPMRHNNDLLVSDEFVRFYENLGCFLGWYFSYMPVGRKPNLDLMPTPAQRMYRQERVRQIRKDFHVVAADFWCDGELCGGCLSAGRAYFHVNPQGGVEPCVFHQFSVDNVLDKPLADALDSEYFRYMREQLKTIKDRNRPCPVIDHPHILRDAIRKFDPKPSQKGGRKTVEELADGLDEYAAELEKLATNGNEKNLDG